MSTDTINAIIFGAVIFIFTIVGVILAINGFKNKQEIKWTLGIFLIILAFLMVIWKDPNMGAALLAIATIVLAIFTGLLVTENKKLREQTDKQVNKDRKEHWLNETVDWLNEVNTTITKSISREMLYCSEFPKKILELTLTFQHELTNFEYFKRLTKSINPSLSNEIETVETKYRDLTRAFNSIRAKDEEALQILAQVSLSKRKKAEELSKEDIWEALDKTLGQGIKNMVDTINPVQIAINKAIIVAVEEKTKLIDS